MTQETQTRINGILRLKPKERAMDPKIRARMLELVSLYRERTERILAAQNAMATQKTLQEVRHTELVASLIPAWQDKATAGNEQSRKAQVDGLLLTDPLYREAHSGYALAEITLREAQVALDNYKFERDILIAIANNDDRQDIPELRSMNPAGLESYLHRTVGELRGTVLPIEDPRD